MPVLQVIRWDCWSRFLWLFLCLKIVELVSWLVLLVERSSFLLFKSLMELLKANTGDKRVINLHLALIYSSLRTIWKAQNALVYRNERRVFMLLPNDISITIFNWVKNRSKLLSFDWLVLCMSPISNLFLWFVLSPWFKSLFNVMLMCCSLFNRNIKE